MADDVQRKYALVLDTNVMLEIYSVHDLFREANRAATSQGLAFFDERNVMYRRKRAHDALVLAQYLNEERLATYNYVPELATIGTKRVPPGKLGEHLERDYTTIFVHNFRETILRDWYSPELTWIESEHEHEESLHGTDVDDHLIEQAKALSAPLITNEEHGADGIVSDPKKIRTRAISLGLAAHTPGEFLAQKGAYVARLAKSHFARFREACPEIVRERRAEWGDDATPRLLELIDVFYRWILFDDRSGWGLR